MNFLVTSIFFAIYVIHKWNMASVITETAKLFTAFIIKYLVLTDKFSTFVVNNNAII